MSIRKANASDIIQILKFCKNTFSWGDYIDDVWNYWISEGYLFLYEKPSPVGICHAFYSGNQIWIEGIRTDPNFRRLKIASNLVMHVESIGKKKDFVFSYMLIDTKNSSSILMAKSLNYDVSQTWNFYSLLPKKTFNFHTCFEKNLDCKLYSHYVKSWRWLPLDDNVLSVLHDQNKIIKSNIYGKESIAILTDSEHFDNTLIVTLFSGSKKNTLELIHFLQNYGIEKNYKRMQILTKEKLSFPDALCHKLSFHLMKKCLT